METPNLEEKTLVTDGGDVWTDTWVDSHIDIGFENMDIFYYENLWWASLDGVPKTVLND